MTTRRRSADCECRRCSQCEDSHHHFMLETTCDEFDEDAAWEEAEVFELCK